MSELRQEHVAFVGIPVVTGERPRALTPERLASIIETAARCSEDPLFEDWVEAVEAYRKQSNAVPEAE